MVEINEKVLPARRAGLLQESEISSVVDKKSADKVLVTNILREWAKDKDFESDLSSIAEKHEIKKDDFVSKLGKVTRVKNASLVLRILETVEVLQNSIGSLDSSEGSKLKKEIFHMKEVIFYVSRCGNSVFLGKDVEIETEEGKKRRINNLLYCNRPVCPNCAAHISKERIALLRPLLEKIINENQYDLYFMTNGIRHHKGVKFKSLRDSLYKIWNGMIHVRWFEEKCAGFVKNAEVTEGSNGMHLHFHSIIALPKDVNGEEFAAKVENYWRVKAKKLGRSCDWSKQKGEWFKSIKIEDLEDVVKYFTCHKEPKQLKDYDILDEVLSSKQKDKNLWNLDPRTFCNIYRESKNMRWYSSSGIFKQKMLPSGEEKEKLIASGNKEGKERKVIFSIPGKKWRELDIADRYLIRDLVANRLIDDATCIFEVQKIIDATIETHSLF